MMTLPFNLPNGEVLDLLGEGPNDMENICLVCGQFDTPISVLLQDFKQAETSKRRLLYYDEIRDQSYFFAGSVGDFDEELQQMIDWADLGEQIFQTLINYSNR